MQLNRNSTFYKFLTMFDPTKFVVGSEYNEEQDKWIPIYRTNTCDIVQTFIGVIFLCLMIAIIGLICCFSIGHELGWLVAMISIMSIISPEPVAVVVTCLICLFSCAVLISWFTESRSNQSIIPEIIKAKMDKVCMDIEIID